MQGRQRKKPPVKNRGAVRPVQSSVIADLLWLLLDTTPTGSATRPSCSPTASTSSTYSVSQFVPRPLRRRGRGRCRGTDRSRTPRGSLTRRWRVDVLQAATVGARGTPEAQIRSFIEEFDPKDQRLISSVRSALRKRFLTRAGVRLLQPLRHRVFADGSTHEFDRLNRRTCRWRESVLRSLGAEKSCDLDGVAAVGLDPVAGPLGDQGQTQHPAVKILAGQVSMQNVATGTGLLRRKPLVVRATRRHIVTSMWSRA
jgi:hypothetical protein